MQEKPRLLWTYWLIALLSTFGVMAMMTQIPFFKVKNLICIEFSKTSDIFLSSFSADKSPTYSNLLHNTVLDFAFIIAYTSLFYFSAKIALNNFGLRRLNFLPVYFLLPGLFDIVENCCMLLIINDPATSKIYFALFYFSVRIKWFFVAQGALLCISILVHKIYDLIIKNHIRNN